METVSPPFIQNSKASLQLMNSRPIRFFRDSILRRFSQKRLKVSIPFMNRSALLLLEIIFCRSLSVPIAMRAVIRHSQGKRGAEEAFVHHNGNSSSLASTVLNGNSFGGGVGMTDHVRLPNDGRAIKAEDTDKGGGSIGGGGGGIEVKTEPMEFEFSGRTSYVVSLLAAPRRAGRWTIFLHPPRPIYNLILHQSSKED